MPIRSLDALPQVLLAHLPEEASGDLLIAFSGGLDSTILLHALANAAIPIRAVHIHHGLHSDASEWEAHCARVAGSLGIQYATQKVVVPRDAEDGLEASARRVRYDALRGLLNPGETLLTAHHADDQLETVLLAMVRGSGLGGLAAMPRCQPFGHGWLLRPLLEFTRAQLLEWARARAIRWIEDPSNASERFDRNYLRAQVIPQLRARWPSVAHTSVRVSSHLGEASELLDAIAADDLRPAMIEACLRVSVLRSLDPPRRRNLLRHWLRLRGARAPSTRKLIAMEHDMLTAQPDRVPCVQWDDVEVRRHRELLYCLPRSQAFTPAVLEWDCRDDLKYPGLPGVLRAEFAHGRGISAVALSRGLSVRWRGGGELLRPHGHRHRRPLKKLLQEANVLPWWRNRLPLVYSADRLVAVADLWIEASFAAAADEEGVSFVWHGRPDLHATAES